MAGNAIFLPVIAVSSFLQRELWAGSSAARKMGEMELSRMGISSHFSPILLPLLKLLLHFPYCFVDDSPFSPISPPFPLPFCTFSAIFLHFPPFPPFPPIPPIFPILPDSKFLVWCVGEFGGGERGCLLLLPRGCCCLAAAPPRQYVLSTRLCVRPRACPRSVPLPRVATPSPAPQEEFVQKFQAHLEATARAAVEANGGQRRSFSQLTTDLYELSLQYRFALPSWLIFVIRAVVTLDGFAADMETPVNAVEAAFPHAVRRLLTPATPEARETLEGLLLTPHGDLNWGFVSELVAAGATTTPAAESGAPHAAPADGGSETLDRLLYVVQELLEDREGTYLRRLVWSLNSPAILRHVLCGLLREAVSFQGPSAETEAQVRQALGHLPRLARRFFRRRPAVPGAAGPAPDPLSSESRVRGASPGRDASHARSASHTYAPDDRLTPSPAVPPPSSAATRHRIHRTLVGQHVRKLLLTPSGLATVACALPVALLLVLRLALRQLLTAGLSGLGGVWQAVARRRVATPPPATAFSMA